MSQRLPLLEATFKNLLADGYVPKSPPSDVYNCVGYAAGDESRVWQGYRVAGYWPEGAKQGREIAALLDAFEKIGYVSCGLDGSLEPDYDKVVLYWDGKKDWTHAARQWIDGRWTSKMGDLEDIIHKTPYALVGPPREYGDVYGYMKRPKSQKGGQ